MDGFLVSLENIKKGRRESYSSAKWKIRQWEMRGVRVREIGTCCGEVEDAPSEFFFFFFCSSCPLLKKVRGSKWEKE